MSIADRGFARIDAALKGHLRILPGGRLTPLFSAAPEPEPFSSIRSQLPDGVGPFLERMDEKLNTILTLLNQQTLHEDFPVQTLICDISGAGLRFSAPRSFELGTAVEMVVELGFQPKVLAGTIGVLIRRDICDDQELWTMKFEEIRACEREKIISFVTARQREQLRDRRSAPAPHGDQK